VFEAVLRRLQVVVDVAAIDREFARVPKFATAP